MNGYEIAWASLIGGGLIFEGVALARQKQGDTLSEFTRHLFRTGDPDHKGSRVGRWAFGLGWAGFAGWFLWHILWQRW